MSEAQKTLHKDKIADLLVLLVLAGLVLLYGVDAIRASTNILNLIFVLPVTVIVLVLCVVQFGIEFLQVTSESSAKDPVKDLIPVMALFAIYVITLNWLGFDVGTFLFIGAFLWLHGERRWPWLIGYSLAFSSLMALFFSFMLPYPMPMLVLTTVY
jgi:putative tricarboxylic transport membrane protein